MRRQETTNGRSRSSRTILSESVAPDHEIKREIPPDETAALGFLAEVLCGEAVWFMGDVRRLIALQDRVGRRPSAVGTTPADGSAPGPPSTTATHTETDGPREIGPGPREP